MPEATSLIYLRGRDYPEDLKKYKLILHGGACMMKRRKQAFP
jgi:hypothetical protein